MKESGRGKLVTFNTDCLVSIVEEKEAAKKWERREKGEKDGTAKNKSHNTYRTNVRKKNNGIEDT